MPNVILFFCVKPAAKGGQTPIADRRRILGRLNSQLRSRFELNGVLYLNNKHGGAGLGRSWMDVFGTKDRKQAEMHLSEDGYQFEWKPDRWTPHFSARTGRAAPSQNPGGCLDQSGGAMSPFKPAAGNTQANAFYLSRG